MVRWSFAVLCLAVLAGAPGLASAQPCGEVPTFADGIVPSQEIHVATSGSDGSGDGSPANPYQTISFAVSQATPGTAVVIHSGTYAGGISLYSVAGTAVAPIWIGGAAGEPLPLIDGGSTGLFVTQGSYVVLHDLELRNATLNGIRMDDGGNYADPLASHHVVLRGLVVGDVGSTGNEDCIRLHGINHFVVADSVVGGCGETGEGIGMLGSHQGLVARNDLDGPFGYGIQTKGGAEDVEIRANHISGAVYRSVDVGGSTGHSYFRPPLSTTEPNFEARNIRVLANVFEGGDASIAFTGSVESVVANNTVVDPNRWVIRILQESVTGGGYTFLPTGDNDFENNLVYFNLAGLSSVVNIGPFTDPPSFGFANNLWYAADDPPNSTPTLPSPETDGIYGEDPLLTDVVGGDYLPVPASPAVRAGLGPARTDGDFAATCYRNPPSIGALEGAQPSSVPSLGLLGVALLAGILLFVGIRR